MSKQKIGYIEKINWIHILAIISVFGMAIALPVSFIMALDNQVVYFLSGMLMAVLYVLGIHVTNAYENYKKPIYRNEMDTIGHEKLKGDD